MRWNPFFFNRIQRPSHHFIDTWGGVFNCAWVRISSHLISSYIYMFETILSQSHSSPIFDFRLLFWELATVYLAPKKWMLFGSSSPRWNDATFGYKCRCLPRVFSPKSIENTRKIEDLLTQITTNWPFFFGGGGCLWPWFFLVPTIGEMNLIWFILLMVQKSCTTWDV